MLTACVLLSSRVSSLDVGRFLSVITWEGSYRCRIDFTAGGGAAQLEFSEV